MRLLDGVVAQPAESTGGRTGVPACVAPTVAGDGGQRKSLLGGAAAKS